MPGDVAKFGVWRWGEFLFILGSWGILYWGNYGIGEFIYLFT
jgi:hypothetical protein